MAFADSSGASPQQVENIAVAVSEAVSNAVVHAYPDAGDPGVVVVQARVREHALEVEVSDEGRGMRPRADSPGMGLGLPLIVRLTETLEVEEANPGVRLRMTFALG